MMKRLFLIIASIILVYLLVLMGALDRPEDSPRFHMKTPVPVDADTSKCNPGKYGGRVLIGALGDPKTFNPLVENESSSRDIIARLYASLTVRNNITQEIVPSLAYAWEFSDDNLELTFHMRRGALWSDGVPITAYDAEFSYTALYDSLVHSSYNDILRVNGQPFVAAAVDSFTFKVTIPSPMAPFLMWAGDVPILPKHILKPYLDKGTFDSAYNVSWPLDNLVSCGPYLVEKYESGVKTVLRRNPNYWRIDRNGNRLPYIERIIHVSFRSPETMLLKFQTGDLDMIEILNLADVPILERDAEKGDYKVLSLGPTLNQNMFWFNMNPGRDKSGKPFVEPYKLKWFTDVRWRKAMAHAVDRQGISATVFNGLAQPSYGPESPANKVWYNPNIIKYDYNLDKTRQYLDSMGLIDHDGDGIREDADGNPVEFTMITNTGNGQRDLIGNLIKDDLAKVGVRMNFNPIEFNTLAVKIDNEYDYDACLLGVGGGDPDPSSGQHMWLSSGRIHFWYPNQQKPATEWEARVDKLMNLQMTTLDRAQRKAYYDEVQYIISDEAPFIYLVTPQVFVAVKNKFRNLVPTILSHRLLWNIEEVWIE
ncbi:ABC transporter substrate-binding protein [bacterium]|nr:ABC transporter substrate-binding protein [bacterium]